MSSASTPSQRTAKIRHVPPEILEKILLDLSVKSLVRFSSVSKSWNSMIFESRFVQEHKSRGRVKIVTMPSPINELTADTSICWISNAALTIEDSTALVHPNEDLSPRRRPRLLAYCDELWLVGTDKSLFLWNHSMRSSRDLRRKARMYEFVYGLAYDAAADDYKVLKIRRQWCSRKSELYSVKSDSWEDIIEDSARTGKIEQQKKCEFVKGAFHWIVTARSSRKRTHTLVSFDLSTRTYRKDVLLLTVEDGGGGGGGWMEAQVCKGELCVCGSELFGGFLQRWFMWVLEMNIRDECPVKTGISLYIGYKHVYFYDNGDFLFTEARGKKNTGLSLYEINTDRREPIIVDGLKINGGFLYVETLVTLK